MGYRVITISRQFSSGGSLIGKKLAEKLGINCYDREIIGKVAEESGLCEKFIEEKGEYGNKVAIEVFFSTGMYYNGPSVEDNIWALQHKIITELAEKEACVIVGRCADYILKNRKDVMNVFIHADKEDRIERLKKECDKKIAIPDVYLKEMDRRRSTYVQFYTDMKWGDSKNYDITLNSSSVGIDACVEILADLYKNNNN
ncbi:MAG: cytidylate kinase-like family protein [Treponema sp.]|nr:cytidylate kinase-like family protein [Treponema sp.]